MYSVLWKVHLSSVANWFIKLVPKFWTLAKAIIYHYPQVLGTRDDLLKRPSFGDIYRWKCNLNVDPGLFFSSTGIVSIRCLKMLTSARRNEAKNYMVEKIYLLNCIEFCNLPPNRFQSSVVNKLQQNGPWKADGIWK